MKFATFLLLVFVISSIRALPLKPQLTLAADDEGEDYDSTEDNTTETTTEPSELDEDDEEEDELSDEEKDLARFGKNEGVVPYSIGSKNTCEEDGDCPAYQGCSSTKICRRLL
ncbi:hypothetical protein HDE_04097 [Halotydeus destructor]|nr:hypothetical protein HDE_04097 [Halotydeus destructor]